MALPTSREEFKAYVLRRLGAPVLKINVADEQVEDRIDDALKYYADYHFDGSERQLLAHQVTDQDKTRRYLELEERYIGVIRVMELSSSFGSQSLFSLTYQFAQSDFLASALTGSLVPYWMAMTHIELVQQVLIGRQPIRFNRHMNRLYIDMDWDRVATGDYVVIECYEALDPEEFTDVWADRWLLMYVTALVKRQWGENVKKYGGMQMAGGMTFNGQQIWDEASAEIEKLESEMIDSYSLPNIDMWG